MKNRKEKGITLVALVITIVILLILAGISISTLTNTGIFEKVKEAKSLSENAEKKQNEVLDEYEKEMDQYGDNTFISKFNSGKIKVGDYVSYIPDIANTNIILDELSTYSGSIANTTSTLKQEMDLKWRVLDVKDGKVRLISEEPTKFKITLSGYNGYNNAVKLLDDVCNNLYNNKEISYNVRNLKLEDILMELREKDYSKIDSNYGIMFTLNKKFYPDILLKEKGQTVNEITGNELDYSEQKNLILQKEKKQADIINVKNTFWKKEISENDFYNNIYYELFINNNDKENDDGYLMSSRCVLGYGVCNYGIRYVANGTIKAALFFNADGGEGTRDFSFRPVITLKPNVELDIENEGDGSLKLPFNIK